MQFCAQCGSRDVERRLPLGDIGLRYVCGTCGAVHYQNPNIVAACVVTWNGAVLLCRRAIEPFIGQWTIPAGYLELGETVEEAARREAEEEAGARVGELNLMALYNLPMFGEVYLVYRGQLAHPVVAAGPESLEVRFFTAAEIPWDALAFPMAREALAYWARERTGSSQGTHTADFFWGPEGAVRVRRAGLQRKQNDR